MAKISCCWQSMSILAFGLKYIVGLSVDQTCQHHTEFQISASHKTCSVTDVMEMSGGSCYSLIRVNDPKP